MNIPHAIAAIDIGTNSIHMVIARSTEGGFEVITREKNSARLGEGGGDMKLMSAQAMDRGIEALRHMRRVADVHRATIFAVATSAVREASNADEFVDRALTEAGIEIRVISGMEEARLIHLGIIQALPLSNKRSLMIDIGGGSTEVVIADHAEELFARSFKLGAVRLTNRFFQSDSLHPASIPSCRRFIESTIAPNQREIRQLGHDIAVVTSGTAETLANMCWGLHHSEAPRSINGLTFTADDLHTVTELIASAESSDERSKLPAMDSQRVDIILAGALILDTIATSLGIKTFTYCDYALREGVLLDASRRLQPHLDADLHNVAIESAKKLSIRCDDDPAHSATVARLACSIFDDLVKLFEIDEHNRIYLEAAALLANVGITVSHSRHHHHSYYIIRNAELLGFTDHEIEIIAQIARYHRKSEPKAQHQQFAALDNKDQYCVRLLSGILRIAIGLDRTHDGRTIGVSVQNLRGTLVITAQGDSVNDLDLNLYATRERSSLLASVFSCPVVVEEEH